MSSLQNLDLLSVGIAVAAIGVIDWNMPRQLAIFLSYLILLGIAAEFYIFARSFLETESREIKIVSFVIVALTSVGIANVLIRFVFLINVAPDFRTRIFDMTLALIGLVFIAVFLPPPVLTKWLPLLWKGRGEAKSSKDQSG